MDRQPKLMNLSKIRDIIEGHHDKMSEKLYYCDELAILRGDASVFRLVVKQQPPFAIDDNRLGLCIRGEARVNLNLVERTFRPGMLFYLGPGTIINPIHIQDDLQIMGIALFNSFPMPFSVGQMPQAFKGQLRDFQLQVDEDSFLTARRILDTLWQLVHHHDYNRQTVGCLVAALMHHYDGLFRSHAKTLQTNMSRDQTIFDRFIQLVNLYATEEHQIAFYASKMCLTERYLGTVIRQASGVTAKEWIDRALIARIKVELRHTDKSITQISEDMHFPNPSFFSKYFKRLTQMTPAEYRQ